MAYLRESCQSQLLYTSSSSQDDADLEAEEEEQTWFVPHIHPRLSQEGQSSLVDASLPHLDRVHHEHQS
eukprot:767861-Hanusia_phi.AAC.1